MAVNGFIYLIILLQLAMGPIYWLFSGNIEIIQYLKTSLFLLFVFFVVSSALFRRQLHFVPRVVFIAFFLMLLITLFNLIRADFNESSLRLLLDIFVPFVIFYCAFSYEKMFGNLMSILQNSSVLISFFSMLIFLNFVLGIPNWTSPYENVPLHLTGLGGGRTSWGAAMVLFIPLILSFNEKGGRYKLFCVLMLLVCLSGLFATQGRGGFLGGLLVIAFYFIIPGKHLRIFERVLLFLVFVIIFIAFIVGQSEYLRIDTLLAGNFTDASNGRSESGSFALGLISEQLLFGASPAGIDLRSFGFDFGQVHSLWLRFLLHGGLLLLLPFLLVYFFFISLVARSYKRNNNTRDSRIMSCMLLGSVLVNSLEPNGVMGSFFNIQIFWFFAGFFVARHYCQVCEHSAYVKPRLRAA